MAAQAGRERDVACSWVPSHGKEAGWFPKSPHDGATWRWMNEEADAAAVAAREEAVRGSAGWSKEHDALVEWADRAIGMAVEAVRLYHRYVGIDFDQ
mmetsp:Transcript_9538/g.28716  ORF Transcript_9538/g.28716 Transcript_9538/m.28716 type:complete len:97 (-) Transcript_9538:86-376(-)